MPYQILQQLIKFNRSGKSLKPQGFVIHSTATPNATAQAEFNYFNGGNRSASVHYFCDWTQIIRTIPENEIAWGCGQTGNSKYIQVEMCEPSDNAKFQEVWNRTVWLVADACVRYGWNTNDDVWSHRGISAKWHETNHTDPIQFLANHGKTWEQLLSAIDAMIATLKTPADVVTPSVLYRVILDGKQIMAIADMNKAVTYMKEAVNNKEATSGIVQRNDGANILVYEGEPVVVVTPPVVVIVVPIEIPEVDKEAIAVELMQQAINVLKEGK